MCDYVRLLRLSLKRTYPSTPVELRRSVERDHRTLELGFKTLSALLSVESEETPANDAKHLWEYFNGPLPKEVTEFLERLGERDAERVAVTASALICRAITAGMAPVVAGLEVEAEGNEFYSRSVALLISLSCAAFKRFECPPTEGHQPANDEPNCENFEQLKAFVNHNLTFALCRLTVAMSIFGTEETGAFRHMDEIPRALLGMFPMEMWPHVLAAMPTLAFDNTYMFAVSTLGAYANALADQFYTLLHSMEICINYLNDPSDSKRSELIHTAMLCNWLDYLNKYVEYNTHVGSQEAGEPVTTWLSQLLSNKVVLEALSRLFEWDHRHCADSLHRLSAFSDNLIFLQYMVAKPGIEAKAKAELLKRFELKTLTNDVLSLKSVLDHLLAEVRGKHPTEFMQIWKLYLDQAKDVNNNADIVEHSFKELLKHMAESLHELLEYAPDDFNKRDCDGRTERVLLNRDVFVRLLDTTGPGNYRNKLEKTLEECASQDDPVRAELGLFLAYALKVRDWERNLDTDNVKIRFMTAMLRRSWKRLSDDLNGTNKTKLLAAVKTVDGKVTKVEAAEGAEKDQVVITVDRTTGNLATNRHNEFKRALEAAGLGLAGRIVGVSVAQRTITVTLHPGTAREWRNWGKHPDFVAEYSGYLLYDKIASDTREGADCLEELEELTEDCGPGLEWLARDARTLNTLVDNLPELYQDSMSTCRTYLTSAVVYLRIHNAIERMRQRDDAEHFMKQFDNIALKAVAILIRYDFMAKEYPELISLALQTRAYAYVNQLELNVNIDEIVADHVAERFDQERESEAFTNLVTNLVVRAGTRLTATESWADDDLALFQKTLAIVASALENKRQLNGLMTTREGQETLRRMLVVANSLEAGGAAWKVPVFAANIAALNTLLDLQTDCTEAPESRRPDLTRLCDFGKAQLERTLTSPCGKFQISAQNDGKRLALGTLSVLDLMIYRAFAQIFGDPRHETSTGYTARGYHCTHEDSAKESAHVHLKWKADPQHRPTAFFHWKMLGPECMLALEFIAKMFLGFTLLPQTKLLLISDYFFARVSLKAGVKPKTIRNKILTDNNQIRSEAPAFIYELRKSFLANGTH